MQNLTNQQFIEKIFDYSNNSEWKFNGDRPAVIDFYADWCGPCKMVAPVLDKLDGEYENVDFYKVDTEQETQLSQALGITSLPSLLFISTNGDKPKLTQGALPEGSLRTIIDELS